LVQSKKNTAISAVFLVALLLAVTCLWELSVTGSVSPQDGWSAKTTFRVYSIDTYSPLGYSLAAISPSTGGSGTIAVIVAFDYPAAQSDLEVFSNQFGLPSANFEKHKMSGTIAVDQGWALEAALDIQWAHAIAPSAKILLVEAKSNSYNDLLAAVSYAASRPDVVAVSMSWGGPEFIGQDRYNSFFTGNPGVAFFASSGDSGSGVIWPSTSSNVVAVGGTTLVLGSDGSVISETAWSGSGGGISAYEAEPLFQVNYGVVGVNGHRAIPDISYNADPSSGVSVYNSLGYAGQTGWFKLGGTSAGTPQWAAIHSLGLSVSNSNLYADAKSADPTLYFRDIVVGSNGGYSASFGYDLVTGLGSPVTFDYSPRPDFSVSVFPSSLSVRNGFSGNSTMTVASINGFNGTVSFLLEVLCNLCFL
jgi:subtilase family serine protease